MAKHKYVKIQVGSEAPVVLMALMMGLRVLDSDDEKVEAASMKEACEKFDDGELHYMKPDYQPKASQLVWWNPDGYEGPMVVRMDLIGSLKGRK